MKHFYVGVHNLQNLKILPECCISFLRLANRKKDIAVNDWIMDSGAFSQISTDGKYAEAITRWNQCGNLKAAVTQDFMCEPQILSKFGITVIEQQEKTLGRFHQLKEQMPSGIYVYLMPVLQGWHPEEYLQHLEMYKLPMNAWVGVGSICRRQKSKEITQIIGKIKGARPDLKLHLFGAKTTALSNPLLNYWTYSADSAAWSFAARRKGGDRNSSEEAYDFWMRIKKLDSGLFKMLERR